VSKEWNPSSVFDVLGCEVAREVLALASVRAVSASELAERCGVSEPTIYRRINALQEYDMLTERTAIDDEGHHHKEYRTMLDEARFSVEDGQYDIDLQLRRDYSDRFVDFWSDLERGAEDVTGGGSRRPDDGPSDVSGG